VVWKGKYTTLEIKHLNKCHQIYMNSIVSRTISSINVFLLLISVTPLLSVHHEQLKQFKLEMIDTIHQSTNVDLWDKKVIGQFNKSKGYITVES